jgi:hypothetical protein
MDRHLDAAHGAMQDNALAGQLDRTDALVGRFVAGLKS